jgi:asparagine synthetase B (glutamine-hydrolysing)
MCSIIGSFSKDKFKELVLLNQHRGTFSYSFLVLNPKKLKIDTLKQDFGSFDLNSIDDATDGYYLGHCQAPTGGLIKDKDRIHPAKIDDVFLFHNGIIKQKDVTRLKMEHETYVEWDTKLMLMEIKKNGLTPTLNTIDGSFACVYVDGLKFRIFRSAAGTLFVDDCGNISSTKFENSNRIEQGNVFVLDLLNNTMITEDKFVSKSSPYFY